MIRMILNGCNGRMGQYITQIVAEDEKIEISAGVDVHDIRDNGYPVFTDLSKCDIDGDVLVDFSSSAALDHVLAFGRSSGIPMILCSTGYSKEQLEQIRQAAREIPILKSANMSLGINTIMKLLKTAAPILADAGYDMEIIEKHHNQKVDAPSGTALALADVINEELGGEYTYQYDRTSQRAKRDPREIGISAVRGGTIVGEHEVLFAGTDEVIEIKHTAYSRAVFAKGAVEAAKYMAGRKPGMYTMTDVIG